MAAEGTIVSLTASSGVNTGSAMPISFKVPPEAPSYSQPHQPHSFAFQKCLFGKN